MRHYKRRRKFKRDVSVNERYRFKYYKDWDHAISHYQSYGYRISEMQSANDYGWARLIRKSDKTSVYLEWERC